MKAILIKSFGAPDQLELGEWPDPIGRKRVRLTDIWKRIRVGVR